MSDDDRKKYLDELWARYDKDKSGFLEKKEAYGLCQELMGHHNIDALSYHEAFLGLDRTDDGMLSKHEIDKFLIWLKNQTTSELKETN